MANSAFYNSDVIVQIDGSSVSEDFIGDLLQVSVEESLHLPSMFTLVINNPYASGIVGDEPWKYTNLIKIGNQIKIGFTTTDSQGQTVSGYILEGEITAVETHFTPDSNAPIVVRGYDVSHRLHRGRYNRSFTNKKDSDIVAQIVQELGISVVDIQQTTEVHEYIYQQNQTNMEFLRLRAAINGFELFVKDGTLYFRKPEQDNIITLEWMKDLSSFRVRVTTTEQVDSVVVRAWDYQTKTSITSQFPPNSATKDQVITDTKVGDGRDYSSLFGNNPQMIVVDQPVESSDQADSIAQSIFNQLEGEFICADGKAPGNLDIRVGRVLELTNMDQYDGKYYLTETRHLYYQGIYTTEFNVRGLRGGNILQVLSSRHRLKPSQTLLVGIVTNNRDPENLGRVKVYFPNLTEQHESAWARIIGVGAGKERGFYCLPEIDDEVLVGFEHGDINRPYIIGNVWNGKDSTPEIVDDVVPDDTETNSGQVLVRTFKTTGGHTVKFVEKNRGSNETGIYLQTNLGHQINLNDNQESIEIITANNEKVLLNKNKIQIRSSGGHLITLDDSVNNNITIQSHGNININASSGQNVNISADLGNINLSSSQVSASNLLSCQTLLAGQILYGLPNAGTVGAQDVMDTINNIETSVSNNQTNITNLTTSVSDNQTTIETLETNVSTNQTTLQHLQTSVSANEQAIDTLEAQSTSSNSTSTTNTSN